MAYAIDDQRIVSIHDVTTPQGIVLELPRTETASATVFHTRQAIQRILSGADDRLLVIIGPCSIHDPRAAVEYAKRLSSERERLAEDLLLVMRVYFEKPRTTVGWKGLINDPDLDGTFNINKGLRLARRLLLDLNELGMPAGTEFLDIISPQYVADLVSWGAIGARTTESQVHRELASGLSCPVGFKNGTDGSLKIATDALLAAARPHVFLSMTKAGNSAIFATAGNPDCHVILRGGKTPNYDTESTGTAARSLSEAGLPARLMVDCSHGNSQKQHRRQLEVAANLAEQIGGGNTSINGVMIESHLVEGRQDLEAARAAGQPLRHGQSITDACLGWDDSIAALEELAAGVRARREALRASIA